MSLDETWRTWLITGTRRPPIDRRRVRGAHKGLKRMLVEGISNGGDRPHSWTRFSGAMVRQAVDDGVRTLPSHQKQLIKLAYCGGLSNAEIARRMGINVSSVERGLQQAVTKVSEYVARGREAGRRAIYAASPNGQIHKLSVAGGKEQSGWPVRVTRDASHEKLAGALNISGRYAATSP